MKLNSREALQAFRSECKAALDKQKYKILVCGGSGCLAAGSKKIFDCLNNALVSRGLPVQLSIEEHVDHPEPVGLKTCGDRKSVV